MAMTTEEISALAREIARANVNASFEFIEETIKDWPEEFRRGVPPVDEENDAQRLKAVRALAPQVEIARQVEAARLAFEQAATQAYDQRQKELAELETMNQRNDAKIGEWHQECAKARRLGLDEPPRPALEENDLSKFQAEMARAF